MPVNEFWYGDVRLLKAYQIAYYRDRYFTAWLQGQYDQAAFGVVVANAFGSKGSKKAEYPKWVDPMTKYTKSNKTNKDNNAEQRKQVEWFANLLSGN